ncbi:type VI secretion system protein TssA [Colwellia sp. MEBiC06753]
MDYKDLFSSVVPGNNGCGENLEDDASFQNFFFEAEGTPEKFDGQNTIPAEPPEWRNVKKSAIEFCAKTRDLKLLSILTQAVLNTEGILKFSECLTGLSLLIQNQWQALYPPLDEDDGDPMERISALGHLTDKSFILDILKNTPLVTSKVAGSVTLRVIERSKDSSLKPEDNDLEPSQIRGIFSDADKEATNDTYLAIQAALTAVIDISETFIREAGNNYAVNFDPLSDVLTHIKIALEDNADLMQETSVEMTTTTDENTSSTISISNTTQSSQNQLSFNIANSQLTSRQDVDKCFELICQYYKEYEPSSPIPVLISRAKKFVHMDFLDIIEDLSPEALAEIMKLGGISESDRKKTDDGQSNIEQAKAAESSTTSVTSDW